MSMKTSHPEVAVHEEWGKLVHTAVKAPHKAPRHQVADELLGMRDASPEALDGACRTRTRPPRLDIVNLRQCEE